MMGLLHFFNGLCLPKTLVPTENPIRGAKGGNSGPAEVGETD